MLTLLCSGHICLFRDNKKGRRCGGAAGSLTFLLTAERGERKSSPCADRKEAGRQPRERIRKFLLTARRKVISFHIRVRSGQDLETDWGREAARKVSEKNPKNLLTSQAAKHK